MSKACEICGKKVAFGRRYARRGLPKKVGGIGLKVTGKTRRKFRPNVQNVRVLEASGRVSTRRICTRCLRKGLRDGTIVKAPRRRHAAYLEEKKRQEEQAEAGA